MLGNCCGLTSGGLSSSAQLHRVSYINAFIAVSFLFSPSRDFLFSTPTSRKVAGSIPDEILAFFLFNFKTTNIHVLVSTSVLRTGIMTASDNMEPVLHRGCILWFISVYINFPVTMNVYGFLQLLALVNMGQNTFFFCSSFFVPENVGEMFVRNVCWLPSQGTLLLTAAMLRTERRPTGTPFLAREWGLAWE
jgi:hypothetical protein